MLSLCLLVLQGRHYYPFMADDAFISLRYSHRLLQGKGLTWNSHERVEGYTNLLWVLLCSLLGGGGLDLVHAARLLGIFSTLAAWLALAAYTWRSCPCTYRCFGAVCSLVSFGLCAPFAVWMIGGLEQPLMIASLGWSIVHLSAYEVDGRTRRLVWASALLAAVALTRADGLLFALLFAVPWIIKGSRERSVRLPAALLLLFPLLATVAQLTFRLHYYHEWLPNTALVKLAFTRHRLLTGTRYVKNALTWNGALLVLWLLGCVQLWRQSPQYRLSLLLTLCPLGVGAYVVLIGGDIFPAARLLVPLLYSCCFAAVHAPESVSDLRLLPRKEGALAILFLVSLLAFSRYQARTAVEERWEWQYKELALYLRETMPRHAVLVSEAAGVVPFYTDFDAFDPLGLCDRHIAHSASEFKGHGPIGHELGDGRYILDQRPDVIIFGPKGVAQIGLPAEVEIVSDPRFRSYYQERQLSFVGSFPWTSKIYLRRVP